MIAAAREHHVKLMIAYRLHFDASNMQAVEVVQSGRLGDPRIFSATFSQQMNADNFRVRPGMSDGTLYDIGIYCINAARYLFQAEPIEALAIASSGADARFGAAIEEMVGAILRFPGGSIAQFTASFGAAFSAGYQVIGSKGDLRVNPGFGGGEAHHYLAVAGQTEEQTYPDQDHFGAQLRYFSDCILEDKQPEPSGEEGLIDVQIIEALYQSAREGRPIALDLPHPAQRPGPAQIIICPPVEATMLVNTKSPVFQKVLVAQPIERGSKVGPVSATDNFLDKIALAVEEDEDGLDSDPVLGDNRRVGGILAVDLLEVHAVAKLGLQFADHGAHRLTDITPNSREHDELGLRQRRGSLQGVAGGCAGGCIVGHSAAVVGAATAAPATGGQHYRNNRHQQQASDIVPFHCFLLSISLYTPNGGQTDAFRDRRPRSIVVDEGRLVIEAHTTSAGAFGN